MNCFDMLNFIVSIRTFRLIILFSWQGIEKFQKAGQAVQGNTLSGEVLI